MFKIDVNELSLTQPRNCQGQHPLKRMANPRSRFYGFRIVSFPGSGSPITNH
ncbi:MAG UNVERIFIED_CONTAM: hypothetical protein LVR29_00705 [Microcystis novacekii LVE1205-3]